LTRTLPSKVYQSKVSVDKVKFSFKKSLTRKEHAHLIALKKAQSTIEIAIEKQEGDKDQKEDDDNILAKVKVRPKTPPYKEISNRFEQSDDFEHADKKYRAIIMLQRLLRGRAHQNMMFEGKEKRLDLIAELRATEEWKAASQGTEQEEERTMIENYQERVLDGVSEGIQAEVIARSLDNLSKELVRMKQERRIAAMVRIAEDVRRRREAEESGRRQAEAILRQREDFLY
jgi:hypothetical protein